MTKNHNKRMTDFSTEELSDQDLDIIITALTKAHPGLSNKSTVAIKEALSKSRIPIPNARALKKSTVKSHKNDPHSLTRLATDLSGSAAIGLITAATLPEIPIIAGIAALAGYFATRKIANKIDNSKFFNEI